MTDTLTQRYIAATVKHLPTSMQADVEVELGTSINDAIEALVEQGEDALEAEKKVLTDLGNPAILAAEYADRPQFLIGPKYFHTWWKLLKLLLVIIPVCVIFGVALAQTLDNASIGAIIGRAIAAGIGAAAQTCFWVTLVFAILERTGVTPDSQWNVDQLPEPTENGTGLSDMIGSLVFLAISILLVVSDHFYGLVRITGADPMSVLNPTLWPGWIFALLLILMAEACFAVALFVQKRWNYTLAAINTGLAVLFVSWALTLLGRGKLFNPQFLDLLSAHEISAETQHVMAIVIGFCIVGIAVWDIADGWIKTLRIRDGVILQLRVAD